jgi:hypothetical protein
MIELVPAALTPGRPRFLVGLVAAAALLLADASTAARAEAAVKGPMDAVQVEAHDSSIAEVLAALRAAFALQYRTSIDLNRPVTGTFSGPVLKVISHLLKDYDYVVRSSAPDRIEVIVIKLSGNDKFSGNDSTKAVSTATSPYPHPLWRARSYLRSFEPKPSRGQGPVPPSP